MQLSAKLTLKPQMTLKTMQLSAKLTFEASNDLENHAIVNKTDLEASHDLENHATVSKTTTNNKLKIPVVAILFGNSSGSNLVCEFQWVQSCLEIPVDLILFGLRH